MAPNTKWLNHLKKVRKQHPNMEWNKVLKKASKTYEKPKKYKNGTPYNYGREWHADRHMFNKEEKYEVPRGARKVALWN